MPQLGRDVPTQVGTRVRAIKSGDSSGIELFGDGTYIGDRVPDMEPFRSMGSANPCIELDNGRGYVWGFECWWGPEDVVKRRFDGVPETLVDPPNTQPLPTSQV